MKGRYVLALLAAVVLVAGAYKINTSGKSEPVQAMRCFQIQIGQHCIKIQ